MGTSTSAPRAQRDRSMTADGAVIGIDIGGTSISTDLVDLSGSSLFVASCPTGQGPRALEAVLSQVTAAQHAAQTLGVELLGIAILSPGHLDEDHGVVRFASNLGWHDMDLRAHITTAIEAAGTGGAVRVALGHDVRWAGIAEGALGAARGMDDYALVSIGTGIAACLVSGGRVLSGVAGSAGEFGHATVVPGGDLCACGRTGCVDTYASGAALLRRYRELGGERAAADVATLVGSLPEDAVAARVWEEGLEALARGLCTLTLTVDPGTIVFAGGLSRAGEALIGPLRPCWRPSCCGSRRLSWRSPRSGTGQAVRERCCWRSPPPDSGITRRRGTRRP
ncbi:ROK family protein [Brachybacterium avium]|nr:ROK family protein [Brachybacterium avium]